MLTGLFGVQVTKVGKGQKLSEAGGLQYCDMTVEDLLRIVMKLAPQESAVEAVEQVSRKAHPTSSGASSLLPAWP